MNLVEEQHPLELRLPRSWTQNLIRCVEMHTTGEPTRIVYEGYPDLKGTLLEQRAEAKRSHDHIRRRLMLEPRGHFDMYGAVLRPDTELTATGQAHIGVLFLTNDGYSTMCGHATITLGRYLLDTIIGRDPNRYDAKHDHVAGTVLLKLHAPCGLLEVTVPTNDTGTLSDPSRPVSFVSVPSFATGVDVKIPIPAHLKWPQLRDRDSVVAEFSYGGAFYCLIPAPELGFAGGLNSSEIGEMNFATKQLKAAVNADSQFRHLFHHPDHNDLGFLYSVMIVDKTIGVTYDSTIDAETGLCFFADQQIDRSPTGSGVAARVALAYAKSDLELGQKRIYHSLVSNSWSGQGAFIGSAVEAIEAQSDYPIVKVRVEGFASYTGYSTFFVEDNDPLGDDGFIFEKLTS